MVRFYEYDLLPNLKFKCMETKSITVALTDHHKEIRKMMKEAPKSRNKYLKLKKHLDIHHQLEEDIFLKKVHKIEAIKDDSLESQEEHFVLNLLLLDLADFPMDHERWAVKYKVLEEIIDHHLTEEEEDLFPLAEEKLDKKELNKMGKEFLELKEKQLQVL